MAEQLGLLDSNPRSSRKPADRPGTRARGSYQPTGAPDGIVHTVRRRGAGTRLDEHTREVGRRGIADVRRILSQSSDAAHTRPGAPGQGTAAA
jgi:hypothetical protein